MSLINNSKESSKLIKKIENLNFVKEAKIISITNITCRNFENTLLYNKNLKEYIANISFNGHNYKVSIKIDNERANPRYERKLKKIFNK